MGNQLINQSTNTSIKLFWLNVEIDCWLWLRGLLRSFINQPTNSNKNDFYLIGVDCEWLASPPLLCWLLVSLPFKRRKGQPLAAPNQIKPSFPFGRERWDWFVLVMAGCKEINPSRSIKNENNFHLLKSDCGLIPLITVIIHFYSSRSKNERNELISLWINEWIEWLLLRCLLHWIYE